MNELSNLGDSRLNSTDAVSHINTTLRLMHQGKMQHAQARAALNELLHTNATDELSRLILGAIEAVDVNEKRKQVSVIKRQT